MGLAFCRQITAMCRQYQQIIRPILAVFWTYSSDMSTAWTYRAYNRVSACCLRQAQAAKWVGVSVAALPEPVEGSEKGESAGRAAA